VATLWSQKPTHVKKRQRRMTDVDEVVLSLYARGLTTGEISAHFADIYGAQVSKDTVSRITDRVVEEMTAPILQESPQPAPVAGERTRVVPASSKCVV
jgi:transposase-like protein